MGEGWKDTEHIQNMTMALARRNRDGKVARWGGEGRAPVECSAALLHAISYPLESKPANGRVVVEMAG